MAFEAFSDEWAKAWGDKLRENGDYQDSAETWEGSIVMTMTADIDLEVAEPRSIFLDLWHGEVRAARAASPDDIEKANYIISADPFTWKQVVDGKLEAIAGIMRGKLKLTRGSMSVLSGYVLASKEMLNSSQSVPTIFPAGLA